GEPPIPGENPLEVLTNIALAEPVPARTLDPDIPVDIEAITMQCLAKDRSARYESARALASDLERFLSGDPVLARRKAGLAYQLRMRLRQHSRLVAVASVALTVTAFSLGVSINARREAAARESLAREFTELVENVEAMARYSALSRSHDIRADQEALRAKMREIEARIARS